METCNACGKTTLLPEKFGNVNICKVCFLKIGGPFWKRQFEKMEDLEKNRNKALQAVHNEQFPADVVFAINSFFLEQWNAMQACNCCGAEVQTLKKFGETQVCQKCYSKLSVDTWLKHEFDDNEEVEECRKRILKIAQKNQYSSEILKEINLLFDAKRETDLVCCIDGGVEQKLKVYKNHCVLITSEWFDTEEMTKRYDRAQKHFKTADSMQVLGTAASLVSQMLPGGGLVKKGVQMAGSALTSAAKNMPAPTEKKPLNVIKGKYRIDYGVFTTAEFQKCGDGEDAVGFIRFYKRNGNVNDTRVFLFEYNETKAEKGYKTICEGMDEFARRREMGQQGQQTPQAIYQASIADEILKFKQLLDAGIITQEEFDYKKKELLGMPPISNT